MLFRSDECTSPHAGKDYLREAMERTHRWAERCLEEFKKISPTPNPLPKGEGAPKYQTADKKTYVELQNATLEMRKNPTKAENITWELIKNNKTGFHFRRQHIIGNFIVDFVCLEKNLVIEVDGDVHDRQKERDMERTNFLEQNNFKVIRFKNNQIIQNANKVLDEIYSALKALPLGEGLGGASQSLFGIVQGGRYEDLRKESAKTISNMELAGRGGGFDGFGIGGSFVKEDMATSVR